MEVLFARSIAQKEKSIIFSQNINIFNHTEKLYSSILERFPKHMAYGIQLELMEEKNLIYLCLCSSFLVILLPIRRGKSTDVSRFIFHYFIF